MLENDLLKILRENSLITESTELSNNFDPASFDGDVNEMLLPLLEDVIPERVILYPDFTSGSYEDELPGSYVEIITDIVSKADNELPIKALKSKKVIDSDGEEQYFIGFSFRTKKYKWEFVVLDESDYYRGITNWAFSATEGGYIYKDNESSLGCCLPKRVVSEFERCGFVNDIPEAPINGVEGKHICFAAYSDDIEREILIDQFDLDIWGATVEEKITEKTDICIGEFDSENVDFAINESVIKMAKDKGILILSPDDLLDLLPDD